MTETDTSATPPRIWTWPVQVRVVCQGEWHEDEPTGDTTATEYVRADLYDALAAERDALKQMLAEAEARGVAKERERCVRVAFGLLCDAGEPGTAAIVGDAIREGEG